MKALDMRLGGLIAAMLLCVFTTTAQQIDWADVHTVTMQGIDQLYHLEFDSAVISFDRVIRMAPTDPRGYFFKASVDYWTYQFTKDQRTFDRFFALSDTVIQLCESLIDQNKYDWKAKFYLGGTYGFRGVMYQRNGSTLNAIWAGKKGYSYLEECAKNDPELYDAQMGFGVFTYLVAKIPRSFRWVLSVIGFSGDVETGLNYLRNAVEKGIYTRSEACLYLAQFLYMEGRTDEALAYVDRLLRQYPDNSFFLLLRASWLSRQSSVDSALTAAKKAVEVNARKNLKFGDELAYSVLANCYWLKNDFRNALDNIELSIRKSDNKDNVGNWLHYRLGICYEMTGDRLRAIESYKKANTTNDNDYGRATFYYRKAMERLAAPLSPADSLLVIAGNELAAKDYARSLTHHRRAFQLSAGDVERQALAAYGLLQTYAATNQFDEVVVMQKQLLALKPMRERWVVPHSYLILAQTYRKLGKKEEAKKAIEMIEQFDGYDFQKSLEDHAANELKKLEEGA